MASESEELIKQVNNVWYPEDYGVGWLKAERLTSEALGRWASSEGRAALPALLDRFHRFPVDVGIHRELIAFFLAEWIVDHTPEESSAWRWSEDVSGFKPVTRATAVSVIETIVTESAETRKKRLDGAWSDEERSKMETEYNVDYSKLVDVFINHLFSNPQARFYAIGSPEQQKNRGSWMRSIFGKHTDAHTHHVARTSRSVIGLSEYAIGMFWIFE